MKRLLLLYIFLFYSCLETGVPVAHQECSSPVDCQNGQICNENYKCVHPCDAGMCGDGVCVKDPEINGEVQYHCECAENMKRKTMCCQKEEYCSDLGVYYTKADIVPDYYCYISIGCFELPSPCNKSAECVGYSEYVNDEIMGFGVCNQNHECQLRCENDNDCIGENEYCHKTEKTCYYGRHLSSCDGGYFSAVEQKCVDFCINDDECIEPLTRCNNLTGSPDTANWCVLPCTTDEECTNFKFSGGSHCNTEKGFCD